ncbi:hypothetical protein V1525DRAFT_406607 [Lipomyces kononenkoae]|uniref:Uncharacterized protein n=1 Tax=Lipomyces kononenkoae TaxID=34357 RepID=A0ACC3SZE8_LIPKO
MIPSPNLLSDRACDQCWSRKVKCNRSKPCTRCSHLSMECSYIRPRKKKGPSRNIGTIPPKSNLTEVVDFMRTPVGGRYIGGTSINADEMLVQSDLFSSLFTDGSSISESAILNDMHYLSNQVPDLVKLDIRTIDSLVNLYAWRMSKHYPVVDSASLLTRLGTREYMQNPDFGALVHSICAFVLLMPVFKHDIVLRDTQTFRERTELAHALVDYAIVMRNMNTYYTEKPSVDSVLTSFFIFKCFDYLRLRHAAWFRLREAVNLAEIVEAQSPDDETTADVDSEKRTTLYRILAVTEHAHAVERRYELSRHLLSRLQQSAFSGRHQSTLGAFGVMKLINLFGVVSLDILDCWNEKCGATSPKGCVKFNMELALNMHRLISEVYNDNNIVGDLLSEDQIADITISQQWLHNRVWNVCYSHGLLKDDDFPYGCREMSISYAIDIARDTMRITKMFAMESLEVHGIGIPLKLYDIASSVIMLISRSQSLRESAIENCKLMSSVIEDLNQFIALFATFAGGQHEYLVPLMMAVAGLPSAY